jgi:hypothetical protein
MIVRISFDISVPSDTPVLVLKDAADAALVLMEGKVEDGVTGGAVAGTCRITMKTNESNARGHS